MDWGPRITYLASTALKERVVPFGIKDHDRLKHVCVIGRAGTGRAALLARMALQDIERGLGTVVLDAGGNLGPLIMERLSKSELERLVHVDAADAEYPFSWNIVAEFRETSRGREVFHDALPSLYGVTRSPLTDILADYVLDGSETSVLSASSVLTDEKERTAAFPPESEKAQLLAEAREKEKGTEAQLIENGKFLSKDTMVRNVIGQRSGKFSVGEVSTGVIIIVDLSRVRIYPTRVAPLVKLFTYALRARTGEGQYATLFMHDCLRYLSERDSDALMNDQSFALTLSDTVYKESDLPLREKALSRCGSVIAFSPHQSDVSLVQKVFYPYVTPEELQGLETGEACVQLTIDSVRARPFFANALDLAERTNASLQDILVESRKKYTLPRTQVDESFKKQAESEKGGKGGQPPFSDAFKNIFAKRDPSKALMPGEKKADPSKPQPEGGIQQAIASLVQGKPDGQLEAGTTRLAPQVVSEVGSVPVEIAEEELRDLLFVSPLPA